MVGSGVRIGLLTTSFPRWPGDVAGHFVHGFAAALAARGHTLEVLAPEPAERTAPPRWPGIDLCWVPYLRPRALQRTFYGAGVPDNLRSDPRAWLGPLPFVAALTAAALERRARWDALVSHFGLPCGLIAGALRERRRHLCVQHSADLHALARLPAAIGTRFSARLARGSSALWFVSEHARAGFLQRLPLALRADALARSRVQPMGVVPAPPPEADRAALRARFGIERFALLTLARLVPVKGLPDAVRALAHRGDLEWLIAGEGPDRASLEALARASSLRVRLLGHVAGAEKNALLHAADAFVLPSCVLPSGRSEGAPTAVLEAMAAGLPVVASAVGGVGELVRPGETGWSFEPRERGALEAAVDQLLRAPQLTRHVVSAARGFAERHSWSTLSPAIEAALGIGPGAPVAPSSAGEGDREPDCEQPARHARAWVAR